MGEYQSAMDDLEKAIQLNPQLGTASSLQRRLISTLAMEFINRGSTYANRGQPGRAIEAYNEALRLNAQEPRVNAFAYFELCQLEQAMNDYGEAIRIEPKDAGAYMNRALAYTYLGKDQEAGRDIDKAVELGLDRTNLLRAVEQAKQDR